MKKHIPYEATLKKPDIDVGDSSSLAQLIDGYKTELRPQRLVEQQTTAWLRDNGLNDQCLAQLPKDQLQALQTCHHLLGTQLSALSRNQQKLLRSYRHTVRNARLRHRVTQGQTYAVLNIGKKLNRQLFQQHRHVGSTKA